MMSQLMLQMTGVTMPQRIATRFGRQGSRGTTLFVLAPRLQTNLPSLDLPCAIHNPIESEIA